MDKYDKEERVGKVFIKLLGGGRFLPTVFYFNDPIPT